MDQIAPQSSRSPSSSSRVKIIIQRIIAITSIILLSHYCPSHASSYYQSFHSSPSDINENGNSSSRSNKQRKKAGETDETREQSQSLLSSSQSSQLLNDSYRRTPETTSKQYPSQQYHHFKWKKNSMDRAPGNRHRDNDNSIHDELYEEDDKIGVPPVRIGGMILNPNHDIDPDEIDTHTSQNDALTDTTNDTKRREAVPRRHRRYEDMLPKQHNKPTEASLLQLPCSLLLRTSTHGSGTTNAVPIATYLDTGAQVTVMTMQAAKRAGLAHLVDGRYAGRAIGVAGVSCGVLGRIPARTVSLVFSGCRGGGNGGDGGSVVVVDRSPAIFVLEEGIGGSGNGDGVELLLGLDSLEDWSAGICLRDRTLTIRSMNISGGGGGDASEEDSVVVSFVNTSGVGGESGRNTKVLTQKETSHQPQRSMANMRSSPSSSIPYVGTVTSQRMPATDLESDLDLLDSTNTGASYHGTDKPTPAVLLRERGGSQENDNLYDDDYYGDDDYSDTDFDYDSCNLSGI